MELRLTISNKSYEWCEELLGGVVLHIKAQPKAAKNQIVGLHGNPPRLKVRIAAPPLDGRANTELLKFLAEVLKVPVSKLRFIRGETSKNKDILCEGISREIVKNIVPSEKQMLFW